MKGDLCLHLTFAGWRTYERSGTWLCVLSPGAPFSSAFQKVESECGLGLWPAHIYHFLRLTIGLCKAEFDR